jgi:hypothetical protein
MASENEVKFDHESYVCYFNKFNIERLATTEDLGLSYLHSPVRRKPRLSDNNLLLNEGGVKDFVTTTHRYTKKLDDKERMIKN